MFTENYHKLQQLYLSAADPSRTAVTTSPYITSDTAISLVDVYGTTRTLNGPYSSSVVNTYGYALPKTLLKPFTNCYLYLTNNTEAAYSDYAPVDSNLTRVGSDSISREIIGSDESKSLKVSLSAIYRNDTAAAISESHLMIMQDIYEESRYRFVIFSHHLDTPITLAAGERKRIEVSLTFPMYY